MAKKNDGKSVPPKKVPKKKKIPMSQAVPKTKPVVKAEQKQVSKKKTKDENAPKRPLSPFFNY
jgi:hypothetical protein